MNFRLSDNKTSIHFEQLVNHLGKVELFLLHCFDVDPFWVVTFSVLPLLQLNFQLIMFARAACFVRLHLIKNSQGYQYHKLWQIIAGIVT